MLWPALGLFSRRRPMGQRYWAVALAQVTRWLEMLTLRLNNYCQRHEMIEAGRVVLERVLHQGCVPAHSYDQRGTDLKKRTYPVPARSQEQQSRLKEQRPQRGFRNWRLESGA
jgi:hypothetical protein